MIKLFKKYVARYKFKAFMGPFFKLIEAVFELIVPLVVAAIIDNGIKGGQGTDYILKMGGILFLLAVVGLCSTMICQYFAAEVSVKVGTKLREDLYKHIMSLSLKEIESINVSSLQTRLISDTMTFQTSVAMFIRLVVRSPFIVIGATIMAFVVSPKMGGIFVISGLLIGLIIFFIMKITLPYSRKIQKNVDDLTTITKENLSGVKVVRAFNKQEYEKKRFNDKTETIERISKRLAKISALLNPLNTIVVNLAVIIIMYFGAFEVNIGNLTQGEVTSLLNYMTQISIAVAAVANLVIVFSKGVASSERINQVFDLKSNIIYGNKQNEDVYEDILKFENVDFTYSDNGENALKCINFSLKEGETIGIIGGTGSGKSTIAKLISRLYDVNNGIIYLKGKPIKEYDKESLTKIVSCVPQKVDLFSGTIRSNLCLRDKNVSEEEMWKALKIAQAEEFVKEKNAQLDEEVYQGGKNFSGGQRQRLTIARALVASPEILILDDSSSALDYKTDALLRSAIKNQLDKMSVIIISQRTNSIKYADKIIVLDDGEIKSIGSHDDLYKNCDIYKEIYDSQNKKEANN